ncbi:MAG: hypothetical protein A2506_11500 [Elusimicrobia bacterium RIFOXYD12_FULL_66_9]|nr:MAG: hypothetical protein A2506_11500 [Elusimicrobia bacterium RIFOXYD12_FULL_66_9]
MKERRVFLWGLLCGAAPLLVFSGALSGGFVNWDDPEVILRNPLIAGLDEAHLRAMASSLYMTAYQPLVWFVYAAIHRAWGLAPAAYHAATWLCHAANAALLYSVSLALLEAAQPGFSRRRWGPAAAAAGVLLWSLHPILASSVAWSSQLADLMAAFFALLGVRCYLEVGRDRRFLVASWILLCLSLLCRWKAVGLPVVLLALDVYPLRRLRPAPRRVLLEKAAFLLPALLAVWINARAKHLAGYAQAGARPYEACVGLLFHLKKFLVPTRLVPLYPIDGADNPLGLSFLAAAALLAALLAAVFLLRRRWPALPVLATAYLVSVTPPLALTNAGPVFTMNTHAYQAFMGAAPVAAWALERGLSSSNAVRSASLAVLGVMLAALSTLSVRSARIWRDSISLWTHTLSVDPKAHVAHLNLAGAYYEEGRLEEAAQQLREHLRLYPQDPLALRSLGNVLRLVPKLGGHPAQVLNNQAVDLCAAGRCAEAIGLLEKALSRDPGSMEIRLNYARALAQLGRGEESRRELEKAAAKRP